MLVVSQANSKLNNCTSRVLQGPQSGGAATVRQDGELLQHFTNDFSLGEFSANSRRALALGVDTIHRNQCIIVQQEFARELGEISPSVCNFGVDAALNTGTNVKRVKPLGPVYFEIASNLLLNKSAG